MDVIEITPSNQNCVQIDPTMCYLQLDNGFRIYVDIMTWEKFTSIYVAIMELIY